MAIEQAALIAQRGLAAAGEGLKDLGQAKIRGEQAQAVQDKFGGETGVILGKDVMRGQSGASAIKTGEALSRLTPEDLIAKYLGKAFGQDFDEAGDSETAKKSLKKAMAEVLPIIKQYRQAMSTRSGSGSGKKDTKFGSVSVSGHDIDLDELLSHLPMKLTTQTDLNYLRAGIKKVNDDFNGKDVTSEEVKAALIKNVLSFSLDKVKGSGGGSGGLLSPEVFKALELDKKDLEDKNELNKELEILNNG